MSFVGFNRIFSWKKAGRLRRRTWTWGEMSAAITNRNVSTSIYGRAEKIFLYPEIMYSMTGFRKINPSEGSIKWKLLFSARKKSKNWAVLCWIAKFDWIVLIFDDVLCRSFFLIIFCI